MFLGSVFQPFSPDDFHMFNLGSGTLEVIWKSEQYQLPFTLSGTTQEKGVVRVTVMK